MTTSNQFPPSGTSVEHTGLMTGAQIAQLAENLGMLSLRLSRASALSGIDRDPELVRLLSRLVRLSDSAATQVHNQLVAREGVIADETELRIANLFAGFLGRPLNDRELVQIVPLIADQLHTVNVFLPDLLAEKPTNREYLKAIEAVIGRRLSTDEKRGLLLNDQGMTFGDLAFAVMFVKAVDSLTPSQVVQILEDKESGGESTVLFSKYAVYVKGRSKIPDRGTFNQKSAEPKPIPRIIQEHSNVPHVPTNDVRLDLQLAFDDRFRTQPAISAKLYPDNSTPAYTPGFKDVSTLSPKVRAVLELLDSVSSEIKPTQSSANLEPINPPEYNSRRDGQTKNGRAVSKSYLVISHLIKSKDFSKDSISHVLNRLGMSHSRHYITTHSSSEEERIKLLIKEAANNGLLKGKEKRGLLIYLNEVILGEAHPRTEFDKLSSMVNTLQPGEQKDAETKIETAFTVGMISKKQRRMLLGRLRESSLPEQVLTEGIITGVIYKIATVYGTIEVPKERFIELVLFNGLDRKKLSNVEYAFASASGVLDYSNLSKVLESNGMKESSRLILFRQLGLDERALIDLFGLEAKQKPHRRPEGDVRETKKPRPICIGLRSSTGTVLWVRTQRATHSIPCAVSDGIQGIGGSRIVFNQVDRRPTRTRERRPSGRLFA